MWFWKINPTSILSLSLSHPIPYFHYNQVLIRKAGSLAFPHLYIHICSKLELAAVHGYWFLVAWTNINYNIPSFSWQNSASWFQYPFSSYSWSSSIFHFVLRFAQHQESEYLCIILPLPTNHHHHHHRRRPRIPTWWWRCFVTLKEVLFIRFKSHMQRGYSLRRKWRIHNFVLLFMKSRVVPIPNQTDDRSVFSTNFTLATFFGFVSKVN